MPGVNGLEVARAASGIAHIVFTTAYDEYALQAFDHGAIDYVLKPVRRDRLERAVQRVRERLQQGRAPDVLSLIDALQSRLHPAEPRSSIRWITASVGSTTKMFPIEDVHFFQAQDKYTRVVTANDEAHIRTPLKELLEGLDSAEFWQVHRSVIVRAQVIRAVHRDADGRMTLQMRGHDERLPVSSSFQYRFKGM